WRFSRQRQLAYRYAQCAPSATPIPGVQRIVDAARRADVDIHAADVSITPPFHARALQRLRGAAASVGRQRSRQDWDMVPGDK
ncbi:hypothetical protein, partial [Xanthomonas oryzae]|uniref:hypothetical protein n=1 Tax=Xanthomonas oryzae TaxID=347 RepID=UPI001C4A0BD7